MKEIKFISHLSRNIYLYCGFYFAVFLITNFHTSINHFLLGLTTFFIGYSPVYFLNDYVDRSEDAKYEKSNLYSYVNNPPVYWIIMILTTITGVTLSYFINPTAAILLIILYLCNIFYSVEPFRLRNKLLLNSIIIFIIYSVKLYYFASLLNFPAIQLPLALVVMSGSIAALSASFYKRHIKRQKVSEYIFSFLFAASWLLMILLYKQVFFLFFPLIFTLIYFHLKYKSK